MNLKSLRSTRNKIQPKNDGPNETITEQESALNLIEEDSLVIRGVQRS
jgi:hypothetical protein